MNRASRRIKFFTWLSGFAALVLIVAAIFAPRPLDWSYSFSRRDNIPFGGHLVFESMNDLFPDQPIETAYSPPDVFIDSIPPGNTNYIFIKGRINMKKEGAATLMDAVSAGNQVFIASEHLYGPLADTLELAYQPEVMPEGNFFSSDSLNFRFTNPELRSSMGYWYPKWMTRFYFSKFDSTRTKVLGYDHKGDVNFIQVDQGEGAFFLHSNPLAFTNYHLLSRNNSEYVFKALSYLPVQPTVWDEYYKPGSRHQEGLFDYVLNHTSLRMAWYTIILGIILLLIFGSRRKQRPIPVIRKPENTTLSFVDTVARLYYSRQDHLDIARKRYTYFLEFLRSRYFINTKGDHSRMISEVARKSGVSERSVTAIFKMGNKLWNFRRITREDLEQFNRQIEFFYNNCR